MRQKTGGPPRRCTGRTGVTPITHLYTVRACCLIVRRPVKTRASRRRRALTGNHSITFLGSGGALADALAFGRISRHYGVTAYVTTPCICGNAGDPYLACRCSPEAISAWQRRPAFQAALAADLVVEAAHTSAEQRMTHQRGRRSESDELLGARVGGFDHQIGSERSPKCRPSLPGDKRFRATLAGEVGVAGVPAHTRGRDIGGHAVVTADAAKGECIGQRAATAQERDRMVAGERDADGAAQVFLARNGVQPAERIYGEGAWKTRQHGVSKRRTWCKMHLGVDEATGEIVAVVTTERDVGDCEALPQLPKALSDPIKQVSADGAYDTNACHQAIAARQALPQRNPPRIVLM
jgi:hypothetical protein